MSTSTMKEIATIAVGSGNQVKVAAATVVGDRAWPGVHVISVAVGSGVAAQPIGWKEIARGAHQRAQAALQAVLEGQFVRGSARQAIDAIGLGMESGVLIDGEEIWLCNLAVVQPVGTRAGVGEGVRLRLPAAWLQPLRAGLTLEEILAGHGVEQAGSGLGVVGWLTRAGLNRQQLWEQAIWAALPCLLRSDFYQSRDRG